MSLFQKLNFIRKQHLTDSIKINNTLFMKSILSAEAEYILPHFYVSNFEFKSKTLRIFISSLATCFTYLSLYKIYCSNARLHCFGFILNLGWFYCWNILFQFLLRQYMLCIAFIFSFIVYLVLMAILQTPVWFGWGTTLKKRTLMTKFRHFLLSNKYVKRKLWQMKNY